ncbi:mediator of DNA damage checkpoint protein 1 isoform X5 [Homo sapiens]|uniref:mediator of DNA damage checkpoint protein 1 isoform X5 n=2 Tax=Homo sapiens TaxID=9606 RepID=UPI000387D8F6|nr:mediator of DNA damage checkpoint protein 1 isoform X5 [Homo sapiens]XP_054184510.1 mediator of DNA damage checkpoint protein 1 isoform X5 [Homo sapiens]XP_054185914.1 mediator of DNA damage checkpoint protein 1 isoform X5 [Homo sapiens]XP_054186408.1 mediator of DNA damage checkpoint protein 1 isoform X5 [Homo sapiens]XP_054186901.1 mediator of DNA damage checkpoint protein 1 isoform X5 [Homo sapiens]XP_054212848.1 mediator of DNA damage checkpoint protein 1 isoform X5 [Homo sapiens]|eukprot:XP_005249554.1 mediator of DNA damage checkpoint protein 1 isoform X6 [Homo sapiens]
MGHPTFPTCQQFPSRVAYFQIMEDTQAIDWDVEEEEETEQSSESLRCNVEPVGRLHIFSGAHGPEKDFPLHLGKNVVGRMPDCSVALPFPSISKQHAEIEILAWDKAPILRDCGSLNGTQILRPPKVLSPGVSHRLRDQELILFADLLCQYHRLDVSLPFVSRGPLTVEETPRVQGETQPQRLLLAEDSEEEVDFLSERRMVKKSRTTSSSVIVPESDEEGHSPVLGGLGPPFAFNLNSDTDVEEGQQPATEEASSAARRGATVEAKQSEAEVVTEIQLEKDQPLVKERDNDTKVKRGAGNGVVPAGVILERSQPPGEDSDTDVDDDSRPPGRPAEVHLERAQPFGFIDSDTDAEEERIPATPVVIPMKKRKIFHGVGTRGPGAPGLAHLQESQAGSDTDVEEGKAPQAVPLEKSQASMVINSDTDDEEEVSAALTLAHLKESQPAIWNRDAEEDMPQRVVLLQRSQTTTERDSDTDVEEEELPVENREAVLKDHTKIRALVRAHSEKDQPPFGDSDDSVEADKSSPGIHLERSQASTTVDINTQVEKEVPPGSAIIHIKKHQVSVEGTNQTDVKAVGGPAKLLVVSLEEAWPLHGDCETDAEEGTSLTASVVADVRKSQLPAEGDAGAEWAAAVLKQERAHEVGAQGGPPVAQVEQDLPISRENLTDLVVDTDTLGESTQPQREGAQVPTGREREQHVGGTKDSEDNYGDSEDLDLQATQCFLENQGLEAVQSMEDEPTQAFMLTPPQELGPSHCSFQTTGTLDEPWEVLATQPFCLRESEDSETQPFDTHLEAYGPCLSPPRAIPGDQHPESPVHTEPMGIQGRGRQTVDKVMGLLNCKMPPAEKASRIRAAEKVSRGDQESPDACLPPTVPEAPAPPQKPLNSQSQKHLAPPPLLSPLLPSIKPTVRKTRQDGSQEAPEAPLSSELEPFHPKPKIRTRKSSRMTPFPATSAAPEPHPSTSTAQPVTPKPTSQATRSRTNRSSVKTPEPVVPTAPELQPSTSTDQPVTSEPTSQVTRGRKSRSSVKTPETVVPTALELQPSTSTDRPVTSEPTSQATRGRKNRSSVKTPEPVVPTAPELQPSTSTDQPVTSEPTYQATRGRKNRSSVKTPEPVVPTAPELRPSTSTDRPVTPKPTSRTTRSRTNMSSVKTPETVVPTAPELQISTSTDQPVTPKPTSRTTRSRTNMSSVKNPESTVPIAPELPPSTSTEQPVTPEPTSRATRGRKNRSSGKTPETLVPTAPKLEPSTSTDQPVTPEPTSQATRGRTNRSSVKTPETVVPTAPELQPSTSTDQPVTPEPTSQATRGRTDRSSVKTPETVVPTAPELQASASTDQPVTSEPTSRTTRGRKNRSSVKTPETVVPAAPELQPSTSTDQPVTPEPTSRATRGRTNRSSVKTPESIVPIAPELQPSTSRNQLVTPEPTSRATRCRTNRSSVKTPEPVVPTAPEPHPTTSTDQPVTPKLTSRATRRKTNRSSVKTPKPVEPAASDLEPFTPTDQSVTPEAIAQGGQSKTLRSSTVRAMPVPTTPEFQSPVTTDQPISPEPITQPSCIKRQRAAGNPGSLAAPIDHKPCSAPLEPKSQASRNQRWGAVRAAESLTAIPEPASPQLLETPIHASQIQKVEPAGRSRFTPELQPKASQSRKRSLATMDSPPHQKQPQRGEVSQKTVIIKEEEEDTAEKPGKEEDVVTPKPGKRKRDQAEEEPNRIPSRSLRRTKLNQESTAPKVLFTGVVDARGERAVLALGGSLAGSAAEASHLVTDRIRRTVKFLCALGRGIPILSLDWLHQSRKAGFFLPPDEYVVTDPEQEKNFGFSLQDALSRARERRLLEGYEIYVTPGVQPPPPQMGEIISCCGGTYLPSMPRSYKPQRVVITCPQDFPHCSIPLRVGLPLLSPEFLLTGVLKQEAKPEAFVLSPLEMSST